LRKHLIVMMPFMMIILMGCTVRHTKDITENLQPAELYKSYEVKPANLKARSKCPVPPTISIVNVETRDVDYVFLNAPAVKRAVNPRELTTAIVEYLKYGFEKSQIKIDNNSSKIIYVSFNDIKLLPRLFTTGSNIKMKVDIPEKKYSEIYEAKDWSAGGSTDTVMAYAIHIVTRQIIDDPVIQDYILCR
jgi:hypothetical protein